MSGLPGLDWIAADWGTTNLRVWAMGCAGAVLARAESDRGMGALDRVGYEPALLALVGGWLPLLALMMDSRTAFFAEKQDPTSLVSVQQFFFTDMHSR